MGSTIPLKNVDKQSVGYLQTITLKDKKAAKKIIRLEKEHPGLYTKEDVKFAKMVKRRIKQEKQATQNTD